MTSLAFTLISVTALFALFLMLRTYLALEICALCGAVTATWVLLLGLLYAGMSLNPVLLGLLMGGSVVGAMYLLQNKLDHRYRIFSLPFLLSGISLAYLAIVKQVDVVALAVLGMLWLLFFVLYVRRHGKRIKDVSQKIIECCKNW